ncbi:amidohydrolase family protein [Rhodococcus wratislaviensis]|uniref:Putative hydrolase n=1 Tax=Rhodococcus wratislaviensis NBRC 100605 TaxID=1219028 RepID=X0PZ91_RHOWR|nr:amidohydrolase family protein [Rhodococcus wratislaviensis]GAF48893.1 putative hydrolase [Rhodococcus wratislaviensis NBRC 100605]
MTKIWTNSGDSHFLEPEDVWSSRLPKALADLTPKSQKDPDGEYETVTVDGQTFRRKLPSSAAAQFVDDGHKPKGVRDARARLGDLDKEGVWGEVIFPSLGMWASTFRTPELLKACMRASNEYALEELVPVSERYVVTGQVSTLRVEDALSEIEWLAEHDFKAVFLPTTPHPSAPDWHRDDWEPFWALCEEAKILPAFHIGTDPVDITAGGAGVVYRGPGGAVMNYTETTFSGQRAAMKLVGSGALDRHPNLNILISEGGATWIPFLGDRLLEGYRQHHQAVRPKLSRDPKEILMSQVYASFQHDETAVAAHDAMGYRNVMFGSDYPHMEGTFGHTQKTLETLFAGASDETTLRITQGAFYELFPHVPPVPDSTDVIQG